MIIVFIMNAYLQQHLSTLLLLYVVYTLRNHLNPYSSKLTLITLNALKIGTKFCVLEQKYKNSKRYIAHRKKFWLRFRVRLGNPQSDIFLSTSKMAFFQKKYYWVFLPLIAGHFLDLLIISVILGLFILG